MRFAALIDQADLPVRAQARTRTLPLPNLPWLESLAFMSMVALLCMAGA